MRYLILSQFCDKKDPKIAATDIIDSIKTK
jgi:hypothetical protein